MELDEKFILRFLFFFPGVETYVRLSQSKSSLISMAWQEVSLEVSLLLRLNLRNKVVCGIGVRKYGANDCINRTFIDIFQIEENYLFCHSFFFKFREK